MPICLGFDCDSEASVVAIFGTGRGDDQRLSYYCAHSCTALSNQHDADLLTILEEVVE